MIPETCYRGKPHKIVNTRIVGIAIRYCEECRDFEYPERVDPDWIRDFKKHYAKPQQEAGKEQGKT